MQSPDQCSRINLVELKAHIVKKLGLERSNQYFFYLQKFLGAKLNKSDFNKLCLTILRRENIPLHNCFISSILRNSCIGKPPPSREWKADDALKHGGDKEIPADGHPKNGLHSSTNQVFGSSGVFNGGYMLPVSPRKVRTSLRDRRNCDQRHSVASHLISAPQMNVGSRTMENGDLTMIKLARSMGYCSRTMQEADNENGNLSSYTSKNSVLKNSTDAPASVHCRYQLELPRKNVSNEGSRRSPLRAPLGLPLCPSSTVAARKALPPSGSCRYNGTSSDGALLDSVALRERMEHTALEQGLDGVSMECAEALNLGLDLYLRGLIRSCYIVVGAKSLTGAKLKEQQSDKKLIIGVKPGHQLQISDHSQHFVAQERNAVLPITLQDFRLAMELRPCQLGEDWPLLLETICTHTFEE